MLDYEALSGDDTANAGETSLDRSLSGDIDLEAKREDAISFIGMY
jgi:hypothetical protein